MVVILKKPEDKGKSDSDSEWALEIPKKTEGASGVSLMSKRIDFNAIDIDEIDTMVSECKAVDGTIEEETEETYSLKEIMDDYKFQRLGQDLYTGNDVVLHFGKEKTRVMFAYSLEDVLPPGDNSKIKDLEARINGVIKKLNSYIQSNGKKPEEYPYNSELKAMLFEYSTNYTLSKNGIKKVIDKANNFNKKIKEFICNEFGKTEEKIKNMPGKEIVYELLPKYEVKS